MLSVQNYSNSNYSYSPSFKAFKPQIKPHKVENNIKRVAKPITLMGSLAFVATKIANIFKADENYTSNEIDKEYHKFLDSFEENSYEDFNESDVEAFRDCSHRFY